QGGITRCRLGLVRNGFTRSAKTLFSLKRRIDAGLQGTPGNFAAKKQRENRPSKEIKKILASHKKPRYYSVIGC
ncbi:MAG: hypothetical protein ACN6PR_05620, partial [Achromobacter sp.]